MRSTFLHTEKSMKAFLKLSKVFCLVQSGIGSCFQGQWTISLSPILCTRQFHCAANTTPSRHATKEGCCAICLCRRTWNSGIPCTRLHGPVICFACVVFERDLASQNHVLLFFHCSGNFSFSSRYTQKPPLQIIDEIPSNIASRID
jgi:hypothetical protein